jgi:predicted PurR-regulated permease PerM
MSQSEKPVPTDHSHGFFERVFGVAIIVLLLWGSFQITRPFAAAIVWGVMISVSIWPLHQRLSRLLGGRLKLSAILLSAALAAVLVMPVAGLLASLTEGVQMLLAKTESAEKIELPPPPKFLAKLPLVGERFQQTWTEAAGNVEGTLTKLQPSLNSAVKWLIASMLDLGLALMQFLLAIAITAPMLIGGPRGGEMLHNLAVRVAPVRGASLVDLAARCIRSVSLGIIGTALLQGALMAIGLAIAGVPGLVLLGFVSFLLALLQIGVFPVWILAAAWLANADHDGMAAFVVVWGIAAGLVDNVTKPYFISHGTGLPLTLIFLGVLGGMIAWGFVGIFIGPTVLAVTYTLTQGWLSAPDQAEAQQGPNNA